MERPRFLTPAQPRGREPITGADGVYVRCYLVLRLSVGLLGFALPVVLLVGDALFLAGPWPAHDSLSAYYHSGLRDIFVGVMWAIAVFLCSYQVFERNLDNTLSWMAGVAAVVFATFPTGRDDDTSQLTPLQDALGESFVGWIHYLAAGTFIGLLGVLCVLFGQREGRRPRGPGQRHSPRFWRDFHWSCAGAIGVALAFMLICKLAGIFSGWFLLVGEIVAIVAFSASWFWKGAERDRLRQLREDAEAAAAGRRPTAP